MRCSKGRDWMGWATVATSTPFRLPGPHPLKLQGGRQAEPAGACSSWSAGVWWAR